MLRVNNPIVQDINGDAFGGTGVVVAETLTTIAELDAKVLKGLFLEFTIAGAGGSLDMFEVQARTHPDGTYRAILDATGDYANNTGIVAHVSEDLTAIAATAGFGWLVLRDLAFEAIRVQVARAAAAAVTVTTRVSGRTND